MSTRARLVEFRIRNFRSISDSGWCRLSPDGITCLIGQNESGKTAILEALEAFYDGRIMSDYQRADGSMPEVYCKFSFTPKTSLPIELSRALMVTKPKDLGRMVRFGIIGRVWDAEGKWVLGLYNAELEPLDFAAQLESSMVYDAPSGMDVDEESEDAAHEGSFVEGQAGIVEEEQEEEEETKSESPAEDETTASAQDLLELLWAMIPEFVMFEDFVSLLPDRIDLDDITKEQSKVEGYEGVRNFLAVSGLDLKVFNTSDQRLIHAHIGQLNREMTEGFQKFWTQRIGKSSKVSIELELHYHDFRVAAKAGKPYLAFWINDEQEKLYPKQRSAGVRWFLSFYLQLKASEALATDRGQVFLIDEPGGSLHAKAQTDVLGFFDAVKDTAQIIYTTHSPYMIELESLNRVLAVQRADRRADDTQTRVLGAHELGASSADTLFPVYTAMGIDLSRQTIIKPTNNIIVEEPSALYYLRAFWKLCESHKEVQFIPATGAGKVPILASVMLGWGIRFGVVVDDDQAGRGAYGKLVRDLYGDSEVADNFIYRISPPEGKGIEHLFSPDDFAKHVIGTSESVAAGRYGEYMREARLSKPLVAREFLFKVESGVVGLDEFSVMSRKGIKTTVTSIETILLNLANEERSESQVMLEESNP